MPPWARQISSSRRLTSTTSSGAPTRRQEVRHHRQPSRRGRRIRIHHQRLPSTLRPPFPCRTTTTTWTAISCSPVKRRLSRIHRPTKKMRTVWRSTTPRLSNRLRSGTSPSSERRPTTASWTSDLHGRGSRLPRRMALHQQQYGKSPSSAIMAALASSDVASILKLPANATTRRGGRR